MRKALLLLILSSHLAAAPFLSNVLGQDLGSIDSLTGSGYEGERNGNTTTIYLDGSVIMTREDSENGYTIERGDVTESVVYGEDGKRVSWFSESPARSEVHQYFYNEDGTLSSLSVSVDGNLERRIEYLDTPSGSLAGTEGSLESYITPSFYVYTLDGNTIRYTYHDNGMVSRTDSSVPPAEYEEDEDGNWIERRDGSIKVYSPEGLLLREEDGERTIQYEYDEDGVISSITESEGDERIVTAYSDGREEKRDEYIGDELVRTRRELDNGDIEEIRYRDGLAEYLIVFEGDGERVKRVERL